MGVATILVMLPRCQKQTFIPPTQEGSTKNLAFIGPAVLERNMFPTRSDKTRLYKMVRGLKRQILNLYGVYVTSIKVLISGAVTAPYMQYTGFLSKQYYKCILRPIDV